MSAIWIDQAQAKADADVLLPFLQDSIANDPNFLVPENIKTIVARWLPIVLSLADCDTLREQVIAWLNTQTGATPTT